MDLLNYLKQEPRARLRANKNRAIGNILQKKHFYTENISRDKMANLVGEILTLDRQWRKILEENPELRGTDYSKKDILEQEKMLELGYSPGYQRDIKTLKLL